uniref:Uncharacterized protein n=1 Tax=Anguilla anguilla TaxID=7936 RepID=A0A0E9WJL9_ANGAN
MCSVLLCTSFKCSPALEIDMLSSFICSGHIFFSQLSMKNQLALEFEKEKQKKPSPTLCFETLYYNCTSSKIF